MPNRVIRDGFLDSDKVNRLDWFVECVYHRLLLVVDDAGRIDGRTDLLVSRLFPLKGRVRANDVESALYGLKEAGLIVSWMVGAQPIIQVTNWRRCGRSQYSRYPDAEGNFAIQYIAQETRDGKVWFVSTSLAREPPPADAMPIPSAPHTDPIPTPSAPHNGQRHTKTKTGTKTGTKTKTETCTLVCSETQQGVSKPAVPSNRPVLTFPCDGAVKTWQLTRTQLDRFRELYPGLNVEAEMRKALAWVEANPERRKTARGMKRFLTRWLNNAQDRYHATKQSIGPGQRHPEDIAGDRWANSDEDQAHAG